MYGSIYKIQNTINKKVYIGQTRRDPKIRFQEYKRSCHNVYLENEINLYGIQNFSFEVIDEADSYEQLNKKEIFWISYYNSTNRELGYNFSQGGCGPQGISWSLESRTQVSKDRKGSKWFHNNCGEKHLVRPNKFELFEGWIPGYGPGRINKPHTDEVKQKIRESNVGKHVRTQEQITQQVETFKSKKFHWYTNGVQNKQISEFDVVPEGFYRGRTITQEQRQKCGQCNLGRTPWNKGLTKDTDERVKKYSDSIKNTLLNKKTENTP